MVSEKHIKFIDSFANVDELLTRYKEQYAQLLNIKRELEKCNIDEAEKAYRTDLLTYQIDEITDADLKIDEEEELIAQKKRIGNAAKIVASIAEADIALNGDDETEGLVATLSTAKDAITTAGRYFTDLEEMAALIDEIYYELREYASDIHSYTADLEFNEGDIDRIEMRLDMIYKLKQKYGTSVEEILSFLKKATEELSSINQFDELQHKLNVQLAHLTRNAQKLAEELSERRNKAATQFTSAVGEELKFLDMPFVRLEVKNDVGELSNDGIDNMEFMISTNPGEPPKSLSKIASGGELSRIMLSLKNVIADKDQVGTLIFDEIDTGVSGRAAQKIGQKLKQVSKGRQIICVTHLAQVACYANHHLLIEKNVRNNRTYTEVRALSSNERVQEIARIIGGADITDTVLKNAEEMLNLAQKQS